MGTYPDQTAKVMPMEKNQQHVLENLAAGVYALDGNTICYVNRVLPQMLGL